MSDKPMTCCGTRVNPDTGHCQNRGEHPRHVTGRMLDRMEQVFRPVSADYGHREGVKAVLVALFAEDATRAGYSPASVGLCHACFTGFCVVVNPDACSGGDCPCDHSEKNLDVDE